MASFKKIPLARDEIEKMEAYSAPLEGRRKLLRLDFNENTVGPSPEVIKTLNQITAEEIAIYPEYQGVTTAIANNINSSEVLSPISPDQIGVFNGVDAAIHSIFYAYGEKNQKFLTTVPTFGYYNPCASMQGMDIIEIPYQNSSFDFPYTEIYQSLIEKKPKILIICNPNNPTGTTLAPKKILELAKASPKTLVVIDELYEAFLGDSLLKVVDLNSIPNLIVLRSLSKTSGLAGLRIGFALGHPDVINRISRVTGPYDVNSFAIKAALAVLSDQAYVDNYIREVLRARQWILDKLRVTPIKFHMNAGNYFLLWPNNETNFIEASLKEAGILVRNMSQKSLLDGSLRVSIGIPEQMKLFWEVYQEIDNIKVLK